MNYQVNDPDISIFDRYTERNLSGGTITFDRQYHRNHHCRFNIMAGRMMGLDASTRVQFIKIGDEWFVCNTELNRGYKLNKTDTAYRVNAGLFVNKFLEERRFTAKAVRFKIKATNHELAGQPLFQIYSSKVLA